MNAVSDLRFAARLLRRNPGSTLAIAGLLALGAEAWISRL
jgi:hypothetical protein